jgi:hypothetical protein
MSKIVLVAVEVGIVEEIAVDLGRRMTGKSRLVKGLSLGRSVEHFSRDPREAAKQPKMPIVSLVVKA